MSIKRIYGLLILLNSLMLIGCYGIGFGAGSYPFVEHYYMPDFEIDESIEWVTKFKKNNEQLCLSNVTLEGEPVTLEDGESYPEIHWYHIYFFDKENDLIFLSWLRADGPRPEYEGKITPAVFGLVSVNIGTDIPKWKQINTRDFSPEENAKMIKRFEDLILKNLEIYIKKESHISVPIIYQRNYKWWTFRGKYTYVNVFDTNKK